MNARSLASAPRGFVHSLLRTLLALWLVLGACAALAQTPARSQAAFDHLKTGFALTGKHVQTRCESCHQNGIFKGTPRDCASCHLSSMRFARGNVVMPQQHLPTQLSCDSCHSTQSFVGARFNHQGVVPGTCTSCHNGSTGSGKPSGHIQTSASCDSCHRTNAWSPATSFDHAGVLPGTCSSCHGAGRASAKPARHMPTNAGQSCDDCHRSFTAWRPTAWNHSQMPVTGQCASCHTGGYPPADGRPANHVPYATVPAAASANCDTCHRGSYSTWANGRLHANVSVTTGCASCHTGTYLNAVGKPNNATHATVTGNCESCHRSTSTWAGARTDHASFNAATNCASCHNGSAAAGKPGNHVPTTASCFSCHNVSPAGWTPTKWNHTQVTVTAACASCHTGGYPPADGRPANHIPYQTVPITAAANCDSCHRGSYTTWGNGRLHANHSISTGCVSCHSGAYLNAVGKPNNATHATITGNCESCHRSTASWGTVTFAHSPANAVGTGTCDTCHNGTSARGKPATHIPVPAGAARCDSCHRSQASFATAVTMNHAVVTTGQCRSCHNGSYLSAGTQGALAKPTNHIPEASQLLNGAAMDCNSCHIGTSVWTTVTMNHNNTQGNGAGWCKGCHTRGQTWLGSMERMSLTHERSTGVTDCSQSGCHRPLGTRGTPYRNWD